MTLIVQPAAAAACDSPVTVALEVEAVDGGGGVGGDGDGALAIFYELCQPREFGLADDIVGDQDIFDASGGHRLGLAEFLADDADGTGGDLLAGYGRGLVGFGMYPERDFEPVTGAL